MRLFLLLLVCCIPGVPSVMAAPTRNVLLLFSYHRLLPAHIELERALQETLATSRDRNVELFAEFLDLPRFSGQEYERTMATYLHEKYVARRPDAIAVVSEAALEFVLRHRARMFPDVPVVHLGIDEAYLPSIQPLPADVVGVPVKWDYLGTVQLALLLHPNTRRLVVVAGASDRDRKLESDLRAELDRLELRPAVEFLSGLPTDVVVKRLGGLGQGDVVYTPGYFSDGAGLFIAPRDSATLMAAASGAPVYGPFSTFIGTGIVGGRMAAFGEMGRQAGKAVNALLDGVPPASLQLPANIPPQVQVDWRQVRKWGIRADAIPQDAIVHFREPTYWEAHRGMVIITLAVILLQAALIAGLLAQRSRRARAEASHRRSEESLQKLTDRLIHILDDERQRVAGELHDGLGQSLAIIRNRALICLRDKADPDCITEQLGEISATAASAIDEVREIAHNLRPFELDRLGLIQALESMIYKVSESLSFRLTSSLDNIDGLLSADAETGVYRIVQEGLNNVIKHASATEARVTVKHLGQELAVTIEDNGKGMKTGGGGFGLAKIKQRAHMLGGSCTVDSRPGRGTILTVRLGLSGGAHGR